MSETKASMVRRAIVRADEDEVRRRVAKALPNASVRWSGDRVLIWGGVIGANCDADEEAALATVGIFHGRDGWEIEARRKLPAPWQWWNVSTGYAVIATSQIEADRANWLADVLDGHLNMFDKPHSQDTFLSVDCGNDVKARERAEDECWSRGLFGAVEDAPHAAPVAAPPVDRAQAIRDALVDALARGPMTDTSLRALLLARDLGTLTRDALVSVGAVSDGHTFRLSDGPPPGWEWYRNALGLYLVRDTSRNVRADRIAWVSPSGDAWNVTRVKIDGDVLAQGEAENEDSAQAAALLACRRAGLFAPPVATEPTDTHRDPAHEATVADLEAQIAGLVARLATVASNEATVAALRAEIVALTRREFAAREGARGLGVQCRAAEDARDMYKRRAEVAEGKLAHTETLRARVTGERDEARLNAVDARAHCASWKARAERAEAILAGVRDSIPAEFTKATP